jgi:pentapeptide repeat protein
MDRAEVLRGWRERWWGLDPGVVGAIGSDLLAGRPVTADVFGEIAGRVDLRGFPLTQVITGRQNGPRRVVVGDEDRARDVRRDARPSWTGLDLSGADLTEMGWMALTVSDCVLDDANMEGLRCWGVKVTATSIRRGKLFHGQLGAPARFWPHRSSWQQVDLSQADLRGAVADVRFEGVSFRNAKFTSTDLEWSDLVDCSFAGVVHGVRIGRRPISDRPPSWTLTGVDFTAARPRDLQLIGVDLGTTAVDIRLPQDDAHWVIDDWRAYLHRVAETIDGLVPGDEKLSAEIWLDHARKDSGPDQLTGFVAAWDLDHLGGAALTELLRRAT